MEEIILNERLSVDDNCQCAHGYVVMSDADGSVLFKKSNMIVKAGRQAIKNMFYENLPFTKICFGSGTDITESADTALTAAIEELYVENDTTNTNGDDNDSLYWDIASHISASDDANDNAIFICAEITFSANLDKKASTKPVTITEAGLFKDKTMFSRVVFTPLTLSPTKTYKLKYYIYF